MFDATLKRMLYCSRNLHTAYTDQDAKRLRNKKHMEVTKLTTLLNFQDHTQDFQDRSKIGLGTNPVISVCFLCFVCFNLIDIY